MSGIGAWVRARRAAVATRLFRFSSRASMIAHYRYLNMLDAKDKQIRLMNYGWVDPIARAPLMPLEAEDEPDRLALQMYHRVVAAADVRDKDVLEVGSGRGGGAAYIAKYLGPRLMHGVDLCASSTIFCLNYWKRPCLAFSQGDAERLNHSDATFDAVVNVESSHAYTRMEQFVAHAFRVLRPGGHFLFADFRRQDLIGPLRDGFVNAGFEVIEEEDLTEGVLLALDAEHDRKRAYIESKVSGRSKATFESFAALRGTPVYRAFETREWRYVRFALRKPGAP